MSNTLDHWLTNVATLLLNFHTFAIVCCSIRNEVNRDFHQVTSIIWLVLKGSNGSVLAQPPPDIPRDIT